MRELLQKLRPVTDRLSKLGNGDADGNSDGNVLAQHARNLIDEALSRSKWVKVADGLPVVPEGQYWAKFWVADKRGNIHKIRILAAYSTATIEHDFRGYTHYMYRQDDTPAPPEEA